MAQELELRVKEVIRRTYNVKSIRLGLDFSADFKAGQFLLVTLSDNPALKRYLSISNSPTEKGYLEFTKKITGSDFSTALDRLRPSDRLKIQFPFGKFTLDNPQAKVAFLSGGIGITPIRSMIKYVIDKDLGTDMVLIYANHALNDIVFKEDLDQMQGVYPKLKVVHVLSEIDVGFKSIPGKVDKPLIISQIGDYRQRIFYLCGPPAMVEAMKNLLSADLALPEENIIRENFQGY